MKRERGGKLQHASFADRDKGRTEQWEVTKKLFQFHADRLGFNQHKEETMTESENLASAAPTQESLF
jgi:hypothetical protein